MADDLPRSSKDATAVRGPIGALRWLRRVFEWFEARFPFGSVTRRIVILNLFGLAILVSGILFLNQFRAGLIDAKVQSLQTQGEIIAEAIASAAAIDTDRVPLDNDQVLELVSGLPADGGRQTGSALLQPDRSHSMTQSRKRYGCVCYAWGP